MNLSWAPSRPGSRNTISKQQKGGKKTPGMTGLAETTPRPSEALFWFSDIELDIEKSLVGFYTKEPWEEPGPRV